MQISTYILLFSALTALSSASPMNAPSPTYASTSPSSITSTPSTPSTYPTATQPSIVIAASSPSTYYHPQPTQSSYIDPLLLEFSDTDIPTTDDLPAELKARNAHPNPVANPEPQSTCTNSGSGNDGCNNSGINNSGTSNSGINNCGTNLSGVGEGCAENDGSDDPSSGVVLAATGTTLGAGAYTTTLTGPTSTVTVVLDREHRRSDCAYWEAQGYVCAGAAGLDARGGSMMAAVVVGVVAGVWMVV